MRIYNFIIYAYLTLLSGLLILCSVLLSIEPSNLTDDSLEGVRILLLLVFILVVIALIILAPKPQRS
jgi:hypothetical protein